MNGFCHTPHPNLNIYCELPHRHFGKEHAGRDIDGRLRRWERTREEREHASCGVNHPKMDLSCALSERHFGKTHAGVDQKGHVVHWQRVEEEREHARKTMADFFGPLPSFADYKESCMGRDYMDSPHYWGDMEQDMEQDMGYARPAHRQNMNMERNMKHEYKRTSLVKILKNYLKRAEEEKQRALKANHDLNAKVHKSIGKALESGTYEFRGGTREVEGRGLDDIASDLTAEFGGRQARASWANGIQQAKGMLLKYETMAGDTVELTDEEFARVAEFENLGQ